MTVIREACERYDLLMDRKRLVEELRGKNDELERANQELKRSDDLKSAFIRVASHELRTPLTIMSGLVDLAGRMPGTSAAMEGVIKRIRSASERMNALVNQVVDMLGAQQFDNTLRLAMTDVGALVSKAADDVRPFVEMRGQKLVVEAPTQELVAQMDAGKIRNAINHLLLNAVKFTPDGGTITVGAARDDDGGVRFWVSDTGIGIEPEALKRIFDRFFTEFDVSTHSSGHFEYGKKGLGLGLSLVKAFVDMHGGRIEAQSEVLRGTTITIHLPRRGGP
jgi:signal transduction histidine kinase